MDLYRAHVLVCCGTGCISSQSPRIIENMEKELAAHGLASEVKVVKTGCFGLCAEGPILVIYPEGVMYYRVSPDDVAEIVSEHLLKGRYVQRLMTVQAAVPLDQARNVEESDFFKKQKRIALRNCGVINPELIDEYIAMVKDLMDRHYHDATRYTSSTFMRMKLDEALTRNEVAPHLYDNASEAQRHLGRSAP